jgi:hypothetical protein
LDHVEGAFKLRAFSSQGDLEIGIPLRLYKLQTPSLHMTNFIEMHHHDRSPADGEGAREAPPCT